MCIRDSTCVAPFRRAVFLTPAVIPACREINADAHSVGCLLYTSDHPIDYAENPEKTANPKYTEADRQAMVDVMEYATNKNKTEQRFFVTGVNCDPTTARDEMMITKAGWSDTSEIVCYHGFQSFKHGCLLYTSCNLLLCR